MGAPESVGQSQSQNEESRALLRDQRSALYAYKVVSEVPEGQRRDYKIVVNDFGANVLRSGLCAAIARLERETGGRGGLLLGHLAGAGLPGLEGVSPDDLPGRVRALDVEAYMIATREVLQMAAWLKRAAQAIFGED